MCETLRIFLSVYIVFMREFVRFKISLVDACNVEMNVKYGCYVTPRPSKIEASHVCVATNVYVRKIYT